MMTREIEFRKGMLVTVLVLACALCTCLLLPGCGSSSDSSTADQGTGKVEQSNSEKSPVTIKDCKRSKDYAGKNTVAVTLAWTNTDEDKAPFDTTYAVRAYVDGEEAERTYGDDGDWYEDQKNIKKGKTQTFKAMYEWDGKSDVEVEVTSWLDSSNVIASKTFKM